VVVRELDGELAALYARPMALWAARPAAT